MPVHRIKIMTIILGILSFIIVFFAPYGYNIHLNPVPNSIPAMIWEYSSYCSFRYLSPLIYYVQFYIFRLVVLCYIIRFLQEKVSRKKVITMGIISDLIPLIVSVPGLFILNSDGDNFFPIIIPIPILLIFVIFLVFIFPIIQKED